MSIKQSTNDFKNIQIHLDDRGRLMIDSDLLLENKGDQIQRYTPIEWDDDRCMYHIATLDNIDIEDLFGFCVRRIKEMGMWNILYHVHLSHTRLQSEKGFYTELTCELAKGSGGAA